MLSGSADSASRTRRSFRVASSQMRARLLCSERMTAPSAASTSARCPALPFGGDSAGKLEELLDRVVDVALAPRCVEREPDARIVGIQFHHGPKAQPPKERGGAFEHLTHR